MPVPGVANPPVPRIDVKFTVPFGFSVAVPAAAVGGVGAFTVGVMVAVAV